jgi:hypothetical protein
VETPGQGPRRKKRPILPPPPQETIDMEPGEELKGIPMEENYQPESDYEAIDIVYELRNPREDEVSQMRKFIPTGTLAGY